MLSKERYNKLYEMFKFVIDDALNAYLDHDLTTDEFIDILVNNKWQLKNCLKEGDSRGMFTQKQYDELHKLIHVLDQLMDQYEVIHCDGSF